MAFQIVKNVAIRGISGCVPKKVEENKDLPFYAPGEADQVIASTGIERRHITSADMTASDLCLKAAECLLEELGWEKESVDLLAFCTQNPDYINHPNSFIVHDKLGLSEQTMCVDFYHGCPGWIVSLSALASMVSCGQIKRAILLDGDTPSKEEDRASREECPIFGDAGIATAIEYDPEAKPMYFNFGTDSADGKALIHHHGGYRNPFTHVTLQQELDRKSADVVTQSSDSHMDSMDIFSFAITKVPKAIKKLIAEYNIDLEAVDNVVLHQANKVILENIAKRLKVSMDKVPLGLCNYGNTTSVSIPLALVTERAQQIAHGPQRNLACAFGTGLAWAVVYFETENVVCPPIQEI